MKKCFFILVGIIFTTLSLQSQQTKKVYNTIVFPKDMPHSVLQSNPPQKDIPIELYGDADFLSFFNSKILQNSQVIACTKDNKNTKKHIISLSPDVDFDLFKSLLISAGVEFVSIEDTILPISSWKEFSAEQARKLWEFNFTLTNLEAKRNWVLQNPDKLEMAKQNGWWEENTKLIEKTILDKKQYIREILK